MTVGVDERGAEGCRDLKAGKAISACGGEIMRYGIATDRSIGIPRPLHLL